MASIEDLTPLADLPAVTREPPPPVRDLKSLDDLPKSPLFTDRFIAITMGGDSHEVSKRQPLSALAHLPPPAFDPVARIIIVEVGNPRIPELAAFFPPSVVKRHINGGDDTLLPLRQEGSDAFLVKWPRLVRQDKTTYEDEMRIRSDKCYDVDTFNHWDPTDLAQNHRRHYRWPDYPIRGYDSVFEGTAGPDIGVFHAADECVSYIQRTVSGILTGYLLVDPPRYHRVFDFTYGRTEEGDKMVSKFRPCFLDDVRPLKRFRDQVAVDIVGIFTRSNPRQNQHMDGGKLKAEVREIIAAYVCDDSSQVLRAMSRSLDEIELSLHDDTKLQSSVARWRDYLGRWRNMVFHEGKAVRALQGEVSVYKGRATMAESNLKVLGEELREARLRIDNVFQSLMSAMSIVESKKAIQEAEGVSKLTQLAFFFIPLSLVSSAFGMNVKEFEDKLTWEIWLVVSIFVMAATYLILYRREFVGYCATLVGIVTSQKSKGLRKLAVLKIQSNRLAFLLAALVFLGGLSVATWQLSLSSLSPGAKTAASIAIWAPVVACILWLYGERVRAVELHGLLRRRRRRLRSFGNG